MGCVFLFIVFSSCVCSIMFLKKSINEVVIYIYIYMFVLNRMT